MISEHGPCRTASFFRYCLQSIFVGKDPWASLSGDIVWQDVQPFVSHTQAPTRLYPYDNMAQRCANMQTCNIPFPLTNNVSCSSDFNEFLLTCWLTTSSSFNETQSNYIHGRFLSCVLCAKLTAILWPRSLTGTGWVQNKHMLCHMAITQFQSILFLFLNLYLGCCLPSNFVQPQCLIETTTAPQLGLPLFEGLRWQETYQQ